MVGGHGTAGAFGPILEDFGISGATTLCTAGATFGLIAGSMMGGPLGKRLIEKKNLLDTVVPEDDSLLVEEEKKHERHASMYPSAVFQLIIAMGLGTIVSRLLSLTGMTFPVYIGAMIVAAFIRNIGEYSGKFTIYMGEINDIGGISLSLFLGIAMITLKLWQLAALALPLLVLLAGQTMLLFVYTNFIVSWEAITTLPFFLPESVALEWERRPTPWQTCRCSVKNMRPPSRLTFWCRWWAAFSQTSSTAWRSLFLSTLYNKKRMSGCGHSREDLCFLEERKKRRQKLLTR